MPSSPSIAHQHKAWQQYLSRYSESPITTPPTGQHWQQVLVIPAYRESDRLITELQTLADKVQEALLVILVLNRPEQDTDTSVNHALRRRTEHLQRSDLSQNLYQLNATSHLLLLDKEQHSGPTPQAQGVGAARKSGCDTALAWIAAGAINSHWIGCTDADATLPKDYFSRLPPPTHFSAAVFPFIHASSPAPDNNAVNRATALYELRLHQYVLGLEYAGSPYAFHCLGSSMAVTADSYAKVRGFPKRAGAEDFYLLNKLVKLKPIKRLDGHCIELAARDSNRVPFGTGPAVSALLQEDELSAAAIFYHPATFELLGNVLALAPRWQHASTAPLAAQFQQQGLSAADAQWTAQALHSAGIDKALQHCRQQSGDSAGFLRHFHQWFDGFRTLKFIHALQHSGYPKQALQSLPDTFWPKRQPADLNTLNLNCRQHWGWRAQSTSYNNI